MKDPRLSGALRKLIYAQIREAKRFMKQKDMHMDPKISMKKGLTHSQIVKKIY